MVALATPLVSLTLRDTSIAELPKQIPAVAAYDRLVAAFPVRVSTQDVAVEAPADRAAQVETALASLGDPQGLRSSADGRTHVLTLPADDGDSSAVQSLRERAAAALGAIPGVRYAVGGAPAEKVDYAAHQREKLPWVMGFVLVLTFLVMLLAFRSIALALVSILVNGLSAAAAFGLLVLVFQHRWAEGLLGFTSTGAVVSWIPLFLFVVLFGLSMDYHIFVLSRIREATAKGAPIRAAVAEGITISAPVVTSAAAVMVAVFATFATLSLMEFKQLGVGLAAAVLIDAIVVRILILPAIISLLGRWVWWPSRVAAAAAPLSATAVSAPVPVRR
jgi:RND superfamily putative drug exporter